MVDALFLLRAMDGIGDRELLLTRDFLELGEQSRRKGRKLWRTVLIAAILALLLAACGAIGSFTGRTRTAITSTLRTTGRKEGFTSS